MLILTRRVGETIRIGGEIRVSVQGIKGGQVRIGISAPKNIEVHREEIFERIVVERANDMRRPDRERATKEITQSKVLPVFKRPGSWR